MSLMALAESVKKEIESILDLQVVTAGQALAHYGQSEAYHAGALPDLAVKPHDVAQVQAIVRICNTYNIPIVGYGAGTSLEGNAAAVQGGVIIDFSEMDKILAVNPEDMTCTVQPGVTREQLDAHIRDTGLFFPVDPGANATLGGMISTRASGTTTVRYGSMRDQILELKVVMPDGTLVKTGTRARKSAAGYDLTHLFTGAEGTLGLIVEATLRLHGRPESVLAATWDFETAKGAIDTVIMTIQSGIPIARMEFLDPAAIAACNAHSKIDLALKPTLFLEFHGSPAQTQEQLETVKSIGMEFGGGTLRHASDTNERNKLWKARHQALPAARALRAGCVAWITDICVPVSKLDEAISNAQTQIEAAHLTAPILGHVGDGNFHVFFILDPNNKTEWDKAKAINESMIAHALSIGGTCTGEHGIGLGKKEYLRREHGDAAISLMRTIKQAIDPKNLMNPGKIF